LVENGMVVTHGPAVLFVIDDLCLQMLLSFGKQSSVMSRSNESHVSVIDNEKPALKRVRERCRHRQSRCAPMSSTHNLWDIDVIAEEGELCPRLYRCVAVVRRFLIVVAGT